MAANRSALSVRREFIGRKQSLRPYRCSDAASKAAP
jgi:hypothetical protein